MAPRLVLAREKVREMVTCGTIEKIDDGSRRLTIGAVPPPSPAFLLSSPEIDFTAQSEVELTRALQHVVE